MGCKQRGAMSETRICQLLYDDPRGEDGQIDTAHLFDSFTHATGGSITGSGRVLISASP